MLCYNTKNYIMTSIAQEKGRQMERRIHNLLSNTNFEVYKEQEVINGLSKHITNFDHFLIKDDVYIAIQDKRLKTTIPVNHINSFRVNVDDASILINENRKKEGKTSIKIVGIFISLLRPSSCSTISSDFANKTNIYGNKFVFINNPDEDLLILEVIEYLYKNGIYLYEDGDLIMNGEIYDF